MTLITWLSWNMFKRVPKCVRWFWRFYGSLTLTHKFGRQANASTIEDFRRCQIRTKATSTPPHFFVCVCQRVLFSPVYCKRFTDQVVLQEAEFWAYSIQWLDYFCNCIGGCAQEIVEEHGYKWQAGKYLHMPFVSACAFGMFTYSGCQWSPGHQDIRDKWIHQETYDIFTSGSLHVTHFHFAHSIVVGLGLEHRQPWHQDQLCSSTSGICGFGTSNQPTVVVAVYMGQWKW